MECILFSIFTKHYRNKQVSGKHAIYRVMLKLKKKRSSAININGYMKYSNKKEIHINSFFKSLGSEFYVEI